MRQGVARLTGAGHVAAQWNLEKPVWRGRMRITSKGVLCRCCWRGRSRAAGAKAAIALQDASTGALFATCPVDEFPGPAVEKARESEGLWAADRLQVTDSSRYFVLRLVHESGVCWRRGRAAHRPQASTHLSAWALQTAATRSTSPLRSRTTSSAAPRKLRR